MFFYNLDFLLYAFLEMWEKSEECLSKFNVDKNPESNKKWSNKCPFPSLVLIRDSTLSDSLSSFFALLIFCTIFHFEVC